MTGKGCASVGRQCDIIRACKPIRVSRMLGVPVTCFLVKQEWTLSAMRAFGLVSEVECAGQEALRSSRGAWPRLSGLSLTGGFGTEKQV